MDFSGDHVPNMLSTTFYHNSCKQCLSLFFEIARDSLSDKNLILRLEDVALKMVDELNNYLAVFFGVGIKWKPLNLFGACMVVVILGGESLAALFGRQKKKNKTKGKESDLKI